MQIAPISPNQFYNPKPRTGKKVAVGLSSLAVNGLGQAVNGQWGKAALFLAGTTAVRIPAQLQAQKIALNIMHDIKTVPEQAWHNFIQSKDTKKLGLALLGLFAIKTLSIIDAVRNTKADIE